MLYLFVNFQAPYNTRVFTPVINNFNPSDTLASEYVGVTVNSGEIYVRKSLTLIANNQLIVSFV